MLRLAARRHPDDPDLERAGDELTHALEELRELARGIHPAVLTERGLEPAVEALATRAPLPVELDVALGEERLPGPVEAAAYYVVAEALTNVAKYARASAVTVGVERVNGHACIEVRDDGVGGAATEGGSGLRGLADRVEALGGRFVRHQSRGGGHDAARRDPRSFLDLTAAELLRSVTRALSSANGEHAFAALPGSLERGERGELRMGRRDALGAGSGRRGAADRDGPAGRRRCAPPPRAWPRRSRCSRRCATWTARRRAMLDVGVRLGRDDGRQRRGRVGQPRGGAPLRLRGGGDGRARGRGADHPALAARRPPQRDRALSAVRARARSSGGGWS